MSAIKDWLYDGIQSSTHMHFKALMRGDVEQCDKQIQQSRRDESTQRNKNRLVLPATSKQFYPIVPESHSETHRFGQCSLSSLFLNAVDIISYNHCHTNIVWSIMVAFNTFVWKSTYLKHPQASHTVVFLVAVQNRKCCRSLHCPSGMVSISV